MFKYVGNISDLSHYIIRDFVENKNVAIFKNAKFRCSRYKRSIRFYYKYVVVV